MAKETLINCMRSGIGYDLTWVVKGKPIYKSPYGLAIILKGVTIGDGAAIVGNVTIADSVATRANAVVSKDVLTPNVTVGGIPAKVISQHGSEDYLIKATEIVKR